MVRQPKRAGSRQSGAGLTERFWRQIASFSAGAEKTTYFLIALHARESGVRPLKSQLKSG
jgi:hypothetical protein